jgi:hypothetical protein
VNLKLDIGVACDSLPKLLLAFTLERGEGDNGCSLGYQRVACYLFDASGSVGLIELVNLGDNYDVRDTRIVHIVDHHGIVLGDASAAIDKLNYALYKIDILILSEITVGKR